LFNNYAVVGSSNTLTTTTLSNQDKVKAVVISNEACPSPGQDTSNTITMTVTPTVAASVFIIANNQVICQGDNVIFTARPTNGGTSPTYQWWVDGIKTGSNSDTLSSRSLRDGSQVYVAMTSSIPCAIGNRTSNYLIMNVKQAVVPAIFITASAITLDKGQTTTLTAITGNTGTSPAYQWQDSTHSNGWTNIAGATVSTFTYTPLATGDKVRCTLTSNAACSSPAVVTSNALTFTINTPTAINPVPVVNYGVHAYPNPAKALLTIDTLKLADRWETLEIMSIDGQQKLILQDISNRTSVSVNVGKLSQGIFMAIMRKKNGETACFKFLKLY